jgi:D-alanyl-D-alanine carboxypeptidase
LVATIVAVSGCGGSGDKAANPPPLERPDLQRTVRKLAQEQHSGALALVVTGEVIWRGASGYAAGKRRAKQEDRFGIASTTKTFVAAVVLQLVGEGRLSLDDSVERWLPGRVREGRRITLRQLLNHTSGLPPDVSFALAPRNAQHPLLFQPGTAHSYSNLNYVILGLIVEKLTGKPLNLVVRNRIFRPLGLEDSSYGTAALRPKVDRLPAWLGAPEELSGPVNGATGIVSTAADLARFFRALLGGELLEDDLLAQMMQTVDTGMKFRAGLGLFETNLSCGSWWGHGGDDLVYSNQVLASHDGRTIVVVAQNTTGWPSVKEQAENMYCHAAAPATTPAQTDSAPSDTRTSRASSPSLKPTTRARNLTSRDAPTAADEFANRTGCDRRRQRLRGSRRPARSQRCAGTRRTRATSPCLRRVPALGRNR